MKEIIAIIRLKKVGATKEALAQMGVPSVTAIPVLGRGKQRGMAGELNIEIRSELVEQGLAAGLNYMKYVPKRLLYVVARDEEVDELVATIIKINQSEQIGDGRIFVSAIDEAIRIRTDETGEKAIL
jgi:nitrogen regulatory protein PII 2